MIPMLLASGGEGPGPWSLFFTQLLGFLVVVGILRLFVWKHLKGFLASRSRRIEESVKKAEEDHTYAVRTIESLENRLRDIDRERNRRIDEAEKEARHGRDDLLALARQTSRQIVDRAGREINLEWEKTRIDLRQDSVRLTLVVAEKLVDRTMDDETHRAMIEGTIANLDKAPWKD